MNALFEGVMIFSSVKKKEYLSLFAFPNAYLVVININSSTDLTHPKRKSKHSQLFVTVKRTSFIFNT